jgi:hypothetical protein
MKRDVILLSMEKLSIEREDQQMQTIFNEKHRCCLA